MQYQLQHNHIHINPTDEDIHDYGLYLINQILLAGGKSLKDDWPYMPQIQQNWEANLGNCLIAEQQRYDAVEQAELAAQNQDSFNLDQRAVFDEIMHAVNYKTGQTFFLHGPGGTGKTYVYNTLCHQIRSQGMIILCIASSGIAALLLKGGRTSHSAFQIPLKINEASTCSITRDSIRAKLLQETALIIWDEALMQHRHLHEAVNRTLKDIFNPDKPFGGVPVVFSGDFHQILPVIEQGSHPQIVGASLQRSVLWPNIKILHLKINMRLNTDNLEEHNFAKWQLEIGKGGHTDEGGTIC